MQIKYDSESRGLYIQLTDVAIATSGEVASGIVFDYDESDNVIGIEIEDAAHVDLETLEAIGLPAYRAKTA